MSFTSPLQYHMNDLVYYLGLNVGGSIDKQIAILERMAAMATGMTHGSADETIKAEVKEFSDAVMFLRSQYLPPLDSNPYLILPTRRMKIALNVISAYAFFLVDSHKLITGNLMRARLVDHFGKDRYMGDLDHER
jgi:hypothetical protein